jgi:hypothetical protein
MRTQENETIEVYHNVGDENNTDVNEKSFKYSFNNYTVWIEICGEGNYYNGVSIDISHQNCQEGFHLRAKEQSKKLVMSIDAVGGRAETDYRDYFAWIKLEQIEKALKLIKSIF